MSVSFSDCFGRLHPAAGRRGVVLAPAFGLEGLSAYRPWADLADRLAARGLPTLRFDWAGTGNSLGSDRDPDRFAAWAESLDGAVDFLKREAGVDEVAIVALRLAATIAVPVAAARSDVPVFAALAPVVSGRMFLREQRSLARLLRVRGDDEPADPDEIGGHAVGGFFVADATAEVLTGRDLRREATPPAPRILLLARDGDAASAELAAVWGERGAAVETSVFPGLEDLIGDPLFARLPEETWDLVVDRLAAGAEPAAASLTSASPTSASPSGASPTSASPSGGSPSGTLAPTAPARNVSSPIAPPPARLVGPGWTETGIDVAPAGLFGIWTEPDAAVDPERAVVILAAGRNTHLGWGRQTVELARSLAAAGHRVLRLDQAGVGESPDRPGGPDEVLYALEGIVDVNETLDALAPLGIRRVSLVGACSGAHLALHAALSEPRVDRLAMINLQRFVWHEGDGFEAAMRNVFRSSNAYAGLVRRRETWMRLLRGEIRVGSIAMELMRRSTGRFVGMVRRLVAADPAVGWLKELARRGVATLFVFGTDDGGRDEFAAHVGSEAAAPRRFPGTRIVLVERTDHSITPREARERLTEILLDDLDRGAADEAAATR